MYLWYLQDNPIFNIENYTLMSLTKGLDHSEGAEISEELMEGDQCWKQRLVMDASSFSAPKPEKASTEGH